MIVSLRKRKKDFHFILIYELLVIQNNNNYELTNFEHFQKLT